MRGHVAAKEIGLPFVVGARPRLLDGAEYLVWPSDRAAYGRLTRLLSEARMAAPKGECPISREQVHAAAEGWLIAAVPPVDPDAAFAAQLVRDAAVLRDPLALPLFLAASSIFRDDGQRIDRLAAMGQG